MKAQVHLHPVHIYDPVHIYEMMARLGIQPGTEVPPRAFQRCQVCQTKKACQDWLDYAPTMVNFAPDFCVNADILFELQCNQPGPRQLSADEAIE